MTVASAAALVPAARVETPWIRAHRRFARNRLAVASLVVLLLVHVASAAGPAMTRHSPFEVDPLATLRPPGPEHLLGTDESGRDVLARLLYGGRVSLAVGVVSVAVSVTLGTLVGALAGYFGGPIDSVLMRTTDGFMALPTFFLLLVILAVFGGPRAGGPGRRHHVLAVYPGTMILLTVLAYNFVGNGLRDALDPQRET